MASNVSQMKYVVYINEISNQKVMAYGVNENEKKKYQYNIISPM